MAPANDGHHLLHQPVGIARHLASRPGLPFLPLRVCHLVQPVNTLQRTVFQESIQALRTIAPHLQESRLQLPAAKVHQHLARLCLAHALQLHQLVFLAQLAHKAVINLSLDGTPLRHLPRLRHACIHSGPRQQPIQIPLAQILLRQRPARRADKRLHLGIHLQAVPHLRVIISGQHNAQPLASFLHIFQNHLRLQLIPAALQQQKRILRHLTHTHAHILWYTFKISLESLLHLRYNILARCGEIVL
ncbi:MAG: hypothetical protein IKV82_06770 [Akkermansia sp.]|nr:hypothetical protein [Akkermansia sp.]